MPFGQVAMTVLVGGACVTVASGFVGATVGGCVGGSVAVGNKVGSAPVGDGTSVTTMTVTAGAVGKGGCVGISVGGMAVETFVAGIVVINGGATVGTNISAVGLGARVMVGGKIGVICCGDCATKIRSRF